MVDSISRESEDRKHSKQAGHDSASPLHKQGIVSPDHEEREFPYSPLMLDAERLEGRANGAARETVMRRAGATHGNRAVQRYFQGSGSSSAVPVQREKDSWWQKAYDQVGFYSDQIGMGGSMLQGADDVLSMAFAGSGMASQAASFGRLTGGLGVATGGLGLVTGLAQMLDPESSTGERIQGGLSATSGGIGLAGGTFAPGLAAGGASGLAAPIAGAGSAGAFGTLGAAIGSGGAVLGAGLAGYGLGTAISENTRVGDHTTDIWGGIDSMLTRGAQGAGIMEEGEHRSAILSASEWASDNPWKAAGIGALAAPVAIPAALGVGAMGLVSGAASGAAEYGGKALDWASDLF